MIFCHRAWPQLLTVAALLVAHSVSEATLPQSVKQTMSRFGVADSDLSVYVISASGKPILSHNPNTLRNPGSTIKLITTLAVLERLNPAHTFSTGVYYKGTVKNGNLDGDIYLKGGGDPYITSEEFWKLTRAIKREGINQISGDLVIDSSYYDEPPGDPGAFDKRPYRLYNVFPDATLVNFKAHHFRFEPAGQGVKILSIPDLPNLKIDNKLRLKRGACRGYQAGIALSVPDSTTARFSGSFPSGCRRFSLSRTVMPPADYAYGLFRFYFQEIGGVITGKVRKEQTDPDAVLLFEWESRPLREIIVAVNKFSNNVMTRMLLLNLGAELYGAPATRDKGIRAIKELYADKGVDVSQLTIDNGAGLSRISRVSAKTMVEILQVGYQSPWMPEFVSSLPLSGLDGTLRKRLKQSATKGRAHLKTGRLDGVSSLAGFVHRADGETYIVAFMLNHPDAHRGVGNVVGDSIVKSLLGK